VSKLDLLGGLKQYADDQKFQDEVAAARFPNKCRLAEHIRDTLNISVPVNAMYDVQIKRIHEYKRQLLNILYVIHRYLAIKAMAPKDRQNVVARVIIFAGKAAPGYAMAKRHIKLINSVADVVNSDSDIGDLLKVVFIPNYNVSLASLIVPAADVNQQISTAGTEASGTSNMKFCINGGLIIGTMDGANVEVAECVGEENMFVFGLRAEEVDQARENMRKGLIPIDPRLKEVFAAIEGGRFGSADALTPIIQALHNNDRYLVIADFAMYCDAQKQMDEAWKNKKEWLRRSILNTAGSGMFSSDRTIHQYAKEIWNVKACPVPTSEERMY